MSNVSQYFTVENVLLVIMAVVIIIGIYNKYKSAKANDGKVDSTELIGILLSINSDVATIIQMADDSKNVKTMEDKRNYVAKHLGDVINKSDFLSQEQKELFHSFGMENLARLIVNKKDEPVEKPKEQLPTEKKEEDSKEGKPTEEVKTETDTK